MPRPCLVCTHSQRQAIEGMILAGASDYEIGRQFNVERSPWIGIGDGTSSSRCENGSRSSPRTPTRETGGRLAGVDIDDREMEPQHPSATHLLAKAFHTKEGQLPLLHQRSDSGCSPITDGIEIESKITMPMSAHGLPVVFSWAERDTDSSEGGSHRYCRDLQRVG
jgi:hypothetical protein